MLKWFGLTRQEEQGFRILGILMLVLIGIRIFVEWYDIPVIPLQNQKVKLLESLSDSLGQTKTFSPPIAKQSVGLRQNLIISPPDKTYRQREKTEINQADSTDLVKLIGIGPVFARRIIAYRQKLGGYHSPDQLREVFGMTDTIFHILTDQIIIDASQIRIIDINQAPYEQLADHPYIKPREVRNIMYYRGKYKQFTTPDEIVQHHLMDTLRYTKLRPYLKAYGAAPGPGQKQ